MCRVFGISLMVISRTTVPPSPVLCRNTQTYVLEILERGIATAYFHVPVLALEATSSPDGRFLAVAGYQGLYVSDANGSDAHLIVANGTGPDFIQSDGSNFADLGIRAVRVPRDLSR